MRGTSDTPLPWPAPKYVQTSKHFVYIPQSAPTNGPSRQQYKTALELSHITKLQWLNYSGSKILVQFKAKFLKHWKTGRQHQKKPERISRPLYYTWGIWVPVRLLAFPERHNWFMLMRNQHLWLLKSGLNVAPPALCSILEPLPWSTNFIPQLRTFTTKGRLPGKKRKFEVKILQNLKGRNKLITPLKQTAFF